MSHQQIQLYTTEDGQVRLNVTQSGETLWLSQAQMAELFGTKRPAITKHLANIFDTQELSEKVACSILEHTTEHGAPAGKTQTREVKHYNLDAIISVGYRANSSRATQFRIWATNTLREHLLEGYTINQNCLKERGVEFEQALALLSQTLTTHSLINDQGKAVVAVIKDYARSWSLLQRYDEQSLKALDRKQSDMRTLPLEDVLTAIRQLNQELIDER